MNKTMEVPVALIKKISRATRAFQDMEDELEDFFLANNKDFILKMRRARAAHLAGKTKPLAELKKELCIK